MELTVAARRRLFLDMVRRRAHPGTGSARVFLERQTAVARWPDLTSVLAGIPWAVVGAVATRAYMPERTTQDLDILVANGDREQVRTRLRNAGLLPVQELAIGGMTWRSPSGVLVAVIESVEAWVPRPSGCQPGTPRGFPCSTFPISS